ncbi:methylamine utilization protein [Alteromonas halophila]|uniref:Methylamine utilization protein n=1 Tax=Alteromonas halophila TaxID=516698 RepID=A0A918JN81_9ALTE|nr:methylamine utilization protein [Alteromonas halophila]GGW87625.1 hypothetical protein GCM10007391_21670 [Alteromonas halophila]
MPIIKSLLLLLLLPVCFKTLATTLTFVDQDGQSLSDVVVTGNSTQPAATQQSNEPVIMDQVDKQFVPHVLLIKQGQQVAFPNSDNIRHHVYSFSEAKPFEIKLYSGDDSAPVTFEKPGIVVLGCNIHDSMVGYIYVQDASRTWLSDTDGKITVPDNVTEIEIWHPHLDVVKTTKQSVTLSENKALQTIRLNLKARPKPETQSNTFGKRTFGH